MFGTRDVFETRDVTDTVDVYEDRDVTETHTFVNLKPIVARLTQELRRFALDNKANFEKQAASNVEEAKRTLLDLMDKIDERVLDIQKQMLTAQFDQTEKQRLVKENQEKADWCQNFEMELKQILDI